MSRDVTVRLSAEIAQYENSMNRAAQVSERAAEAADRAATSTQAAGRKTQESGLQAAEGVSASSDALYRLTDGMSGTAPTLNETANGLAGITESSAGAGFAFTTASVSADDFTGALYGIGGGLEVTQGRMSTLLDRASGMRQEFTTMGVALGAVGGGLAAVAGSIINTGIAYNTLQQVSGRAMVTMMGSASAAADQMERLHQFADESPFARDVWISAQQQLMAFGMEADRVVPTLEGVQNAVAAIGGGNNEIMQLVDILGSIEGQGKITGRELQRMGQMGINAADLMASSLGMTGNEIREQITEGSMDSLTAITALTDGMQQRFDGAAQGLRDTYEGSLDRIRARIRDLGSVIAAPLVDPNGGGFLVEAINMAADFGNALLKLPDPLIQVAGLGAAAAGGLALVGGSVALALPHITTFIGGVRDAYGVVRDFGSGAVSAAGGMRRLGLAAGVAAVGIGGLMALDWAWDNLSAGTVTISELEQALLQASNRGGSALGDLSTMVQNLDSTSGAAASKLGHFAGLLGFVNPAAMVAARATQDYDAHLSQVDDTLSSLVSSGNFTRAAQGIKEVTDQLTLEEIQEYFPGLVDELQTLANQAEVTASLSELLEIATSNAALEALEAGESWSVIKASYEAGEYAAESFAGVTISLGAALREQSSLTSDAADSIAGLIGVMGEYAGVALSAEQTTDSWIAEMQALQASINEGGFTLDAYTESGRKNREMLRGLATGTWDVASAVAVQGGTLEDVNGTIMDNVDALERAGQAANMSESEIDDMIRTYMGFNDFEPIEIQAENRAAEIFREVESQYQDLPDDWDIRINALADDAAAVVNAIVDGDHEAVVNILGDDVLAQHVIDAFSNGDYEAVARIMGDPTDARNVAYDFISGTYVATADIEGNINPADETMAAFLNGDHKTAAEIAADDSEAQATLHALLTGRYDTTAFIYGDDDSARTTMLGFTSYPWRTGVDVDAATAEAERAINWTARDRSMNIRVSYTAPAGPPGTRGAVPGYAMGGRVGMGLTGLPGLTTGGRLPYTGLGTDMILGVNAAGMPVARVDDLEYVTNRRSTDRHLPLLEAINSNDLFGMRRYLERLPAHAAGGRAGYQGPVREFHGTGAPRFPSDGFDGLISAMQSARPLIGQISATGGDTTQVINRVGDAIFRRLREEGVPVGQF